MAAKTNIKFPKEIVEHYVNLLNRKIKVEGVLLFGSFAWGEPDKHSDVDLAIISSDLKRIPNRLRWLSRMRDKRTHQIAMDVVGFTPKEFEDIQEHSAIMAKAKRQGKWIRRV